MLPVFIMYEKKKIYPVHNFPTEDLVKNKMVEYFPVYVYVIISPQTYTSEEIDPGLDWIRIHFAWHLFFFFTK